MNRAILLDPATVIDLFLDRSLGRWYDIFFGNIDSNRWKNWLLITAVVDDINNLSPELLYKSHIAGIESV